MSPGALVVLDHGWRKTTIAPPTRSRPGMSPLERRSSLSVLSASPRDGEGPVFVRRPTDYDAARRRRPKILVPFLQASHEMPSSCPCPCPEPVEFGHGHGHDRTSTALRPTLENVQTPVWRKPAGTSSNGPPEVPFSASCGMVVRLEQCFQVVGDQHPETRIQHRPPLKLVTSVAVSPYEGGLVAAHRAVVMTV